MVCFWFCFAAHLPHDRFFTKIPGSMHLTGKKFPFSRQRELTGKRLIPLIVFGARTALSEPNRKNCRFYGNNRECQVFGRGAIRGL